MIGHSLGGSELYYSKLSIPKFLFDPGVSWLRALSTNLSIFHTYGDLVSGGWLTTDSNIYEFADIVQVPHAMANFTGYLTGSEENEDFNKILTKLPKKQ